MSTDIYIDNLPFDVTAVEIRTLFGLYGPVETVHLIKDRETGRLHGFGFVNMTTGADKAITALNDSALGNSRIKIKYPAKGQPKHPPRSHDW